MNITVTAERPEADKVVAKVVVAKKDIDAALKKTYKDIAQRYNFQGFRRGRAPRPVIDGILGRESVLAQATNDVLNAVQPLVLEQLDLVPMGQPSFGDDPELIAEGSDYTCELTMDVPPTCELKSYDAPDIQMPPEEATEAEIDLQIQQLLSYQTTYEDDESGRACEAGDIISCDIENKEGAETLAGKNRTIALSGVGLPQELVDGIVGMKAGEEKEISWTESHTHGDETHEHTRTVGVKLNAIKRIVVPELTDELAQKNFGYDTVAELRDAVKEEIEADKVNSLPSLKEDRVVEAIGRELDLEEVPEAYATQVFNELANEFMNQLQRQGMSLDMYLQGNQIESADFIADLHKQADERARQSLALDALAAKLDLEATAEDVQAEFERAGIAAKEIAAAMKDFVDQGRMPAVRESIRRTKAVKWLAEHANVTVVDEIAERQAAADAEAEDADVAADTEATAEDTQE